MPAPHILLVLAALALIVPLQAQQVSLQALVTPSTTIMKDGRPVTFALHGFIEFKTLADMFPYIDSQKQRWKIQPGRCRTAAPGRRTAAARN